MASEKTVSQLRAGGCAVCVFTPKELRGVSPRLVEDAMCEAGHNAIDWNGEPESKDQDESVEECY